MTIIGHRFLVRFTGLRYLHRVIGMDGIKQRLMGALNSLPMITKPGDYTKTQACIGVTKLS